MKLLLKFVSKYKRLLLFLILSFSVVATFQVWNAVFVAEITARTVDALKSGIAEKIYVDMLSDTTIKMLLMATGIGAFTILCGKLAGRVAIRVAEDIRRSLYEKTMTFSLKEINYFGVSSMINRNTNDVLQVQGGLYMLLTTALPVPFLVIGGFLGLSQYGNKMLLRVILGIISMCAVFVVFIYKAAPLFQRMTSELDLLNRVTREGLSGVQILRALNREKWNGDRMREYSAKLRKTAEGTTFTGEMLQPTIYLVFNLLIVSILWNGGHYVHENMMNIGDVVAYISYLYMIVSGMIMAMMACFQIPAVLISMKRIGEILSTEPSIASGKGVNINTLPDYAVEFENVSFRYSEDSRMVVRNISFTAKQGELTVLLGNTGCGKTTLMQLIPRLYDASEGVIRIGGVNIRDMKLDELRSMIGYVPQRAFLYRGDIRSNIAFRDKSMEDEKVRNAAELSQSMQFIKGMKKGFAEWIAQGGSNVSGGQRQRLTIARALGGSPKILILDDSASALDLETGLKLRNALQSIIKDLTVIFVTQRSAFLRVADKIVVMQDGCIQATGTDEELKQSCDIYRNILQSQVGA